MDTAWTNALYFGDNLTILREHISDESIDLIYLDPPFNSQAAYNILFRAPNGEQSHAQIEAFDDTWHWNDIAERAFDEVLHSGNTAIAEMLRAMRTFLKENDLMAYLTMMAIRLVELHRVLKSTGSIYLHCDPTASHYLKLLMDAIFHIKNFRNEIVWHYSGWNKKLRSHFERRHDTLLYYSKAEPQFNSYSIPYSSQEEYLSIRKQKLYIDANGEAYTLDVRDGKKRIVKVYIAEALQRGKPLDSVWNIDKVNNSSKERLGYPTQKPLPLLERIIHASSNEHSVLLDPFCGCGTAIHAAQKLGRRWIGIDITHLAISLIEKRLKDAFPGIAYEVHGTPKDLDGARALAAQDKYQFQWWAVSLVNAVPYGGKKKGADSGIDGILYFKPDDKQTEKAIVSVKGGANISVPMIRDLAHVVDREHAKMGVFVTLTPPTGPMEKEATTAGFYDSPYHGKLPKIQILTIADLFAGKKAVVPFVDPVSFRRVQPEELAPQERLFA